MEMDGGMDALCRRGLKGDAFLGELLEGIRQRIKPESRLWCEVYPGPFMLRERRPTLAVYVLRQGAFLTTDVPHRPRHLISSLCAPSESPPGGLELRRDPRRSMVHWFWS